MSAAFDDYVRRNGERLVRTAYLLTGDRNLAEDIVQNAFTSVLTSWRRLRDVSNLDAYMYAAVVNARTRWWQRGPRAEIPSEVVPDRVDAGSYGRFDEYDEMMTALAQLGPRQRAVLVLRFYEDLSEADVARILGCSPGTVKSQTSRGLEKLRAAMIRARKPVADPGGAR